MQIMTIKLDDDMDILLKKSLKPYYTTKTEFVREAIRDKLKNLEKERIIQKIAKLKGTVKNNPKELTEKDYEDIIKDLKSKTTSQKLREYNLEGIPCIRKI